MIFAKGEVDESKGNYVVATEVFINGATPQIIAEYRAIGEELIKNMHNIPNEFQGLYTEQILKQITEIGERLVKKYQEVSKE